jgi:uncharacterized membrane-anchored protein YitT (DUF2179 family)
MQLQTRQYGRTTEQKVQEIINNRKNKLNHNRTLHYTEGGVTDRNASAFYCLILSFIVTNELLIQFVNTY